jgi:predicted DNA-binding transcriptional regulator AlpA
MQGNGTAPKLLLKPREAAAALGLSEKSLWSLTQPRGPIPVVRVGERSVRYSVAALEKWIAGQAAEVGATQ